MSDAQQARSTGRAAGGPGGRRPFLIAGPCVLEGVEMALRVAEGMQAECARCGIEYVFKASYLKDNRTRAAAQSGPGLEEGLAQLARVKRETGVRLLTDVHAVTQVAAVAEVVDVLQVPAFLCRQTSLVRACARSGRVVNLKKGQFLAMADMGHVLAKARDANPAAEIWLTERGTFFGYHDLVVDMRAIAHMRTLGAPVVFDVTHSLQHPGHGGNRGFARPLARAGLAAGAEGIFAEVHPDPPSAQSDRDTQLPLAEMPALLDEWVRVGEVIRALEAGVAPVDAADGVTR